MKVAVVLCKSAVSALLPRKKTNSLFYTLCFSKRLCVWGSGEGGGDAERITRRPRGGTGTQNNIGLLWLSWFTQFC